MKIPGYLVDFDTTDGLSLSGFLTDNNNEYLVVFVHGLGVSFHRGYFLEDLIMELSKNKFDFFSFDNRGAHYITRIPNSRGDKKPRGYSYELFEESILDIEAAVKFIKQEFPNKKIILAGKSSGAQKVVYSYNQSEYIRQNIQGLVLISPCDDVGLLISHLGSDGLKALLEKMNILIKEGKGEELQVIPEFFNKPITPVTFISHFGEKNKFDIFHYYDPNKSWKDLEYIDTKVLIIFGEHDLVDDMSSVEKIWKSNVKDVKFKIIGGAEHSFKDSGKDISLEIVSIFRDSLWK